jgi:hypothetical protein
MSKKHGEITARLGDQLGRSNDLAKLNYFVVYDHGKGGEESVGVTSAYLGDHAEMDNRLSEIDVAIVEKKTQKAILLIEIEESGDNPKKIIGAAMATLLADGLSSKDGQKLTVDSETTLMVLAKGEGVEHKDRIRSIETRIKQLISMEGFNKNVKIETIKLELFQDPDELPEKIITFLKSHPPTG